MLSSISGLRRLQVQIGLVPSAVEHGLAPVIQGAIASTMKNQPLQLYFLAIIQCKLEEVQHAHPCTELDTCRLEKFASAGLQFLPCLERLSVDMDGTVSGLQLHRVLKVRDARVYCGLLCKCRIEEQHQSRYMAALEQMC